MIISPSKGFIFIHLEKCGGTSVETALQPHLEWYDTILGSTEFGESLQELYYQRYSHDDVKKFMLWKHSTAKDIYSFLLDGWHDFKKISVVRDPEELLKSLYFFSQTVNKYHVGRINREVWKEYVRIWQFPDAFPYRDKYFVAYAKSEVDGSGIDGFIDFVIKNNYSFVSPQTERLDIGDGDLGMVIDLSDLNNRWKEVLENIGIKENIKLKNLNISERNNIDISQKSRKLIRKHFAIDYDTLPRYTGVHW